MSPNRFKRLVVVEGRAAARFATGLQACYERAGVPAVAINGYVADPLAAVRRTEAIVVATMSGPGGRYVWEWRSRVFEAAAISLLAQSATLATINKHPDPSLRGTLVKLSRKVPPELQILERRA